MQLLPTSQRWQCFHNVETSNQILRQRGVSPLDDSSQSLPTQVFSDSLALREHAESFPQIYSCLQVLGHTLQSAVGSRNWGAVLSQSRNPPVFGVVQRIVHREKRPSCQQLVEKNGCGSSCVFICIINTWKTKTISIIQQLQPFSS